jgi:hypothetical protein
VSRSYPTSDGGVFLVHLGDLPGSDGTPFGDATNTPPSSRATQYYYPIANVNHPSGLQTFGKYAAVGVEAPSPPSFIQFYDFGTPGSANAAIHRFYLNNNQGETPAVDRAVGGVGITRLIDNRYLMVVLGQDTSQRAWFYVSQNTSMASSPGWSYLGNIALPKAQNTQLITECGTGNVYLLATDNDGYKAASTNRYGNNGYLRQITYSGFTLTSTVADDELFDSGDGDFCSFRAAASSYIDPNGNLDIICHTRNAPYNPGDTLQPLKFAEFTQYL